MVAVLATMLAAFALAGFRLAVYGLLILAGTAGVTVAAVAVGRDTGSRFAMLALCVACALAALAVLLAFPPLEISQAGIRHKAWGLTSRGIAFGLAVAAAVASSRLEPRPPRRRSSSPPGAPY